MIGIESKAKTTEERKTGASGAKPRHAPNQKVSPLVHRLGTAQLEMGKGWMVGGEVRWQGRRRSFKKESNGVTVLIIKKEARKEKVEVRGGGHS
ncbi:hypothetical protein RHMOL_Rhmol12G0126900 [Rhododendron molle]|uniref:Uncharacterized protein n=1 Tax=Rhododendron molle TaxID=49168 RepID=A0ACC0LH82_RHOML|nr:hypothetical protein RHMOL_Rhmol12G0126900 [Rhododendron molle]